MDPFRWIASMFLVCHQGEIAFFWGSGKYKNRWCPVKENIYFRICRNHCTNKNKGKREIQKGIFPCLERIFFRICHDMHLLFLESNKMCLFFANTSVFEFAFSAKSQTACMFTYSRGSIDTRA